MQTTKPDTVLQLLRELGLTVQHPTRLVIGGSIALILADALGRRTEDIHIVDEVPAEIRSQHDLLHGLANRYGLHLTHFQSHYLPAGWESRLHSLGLFGRLQVFLVDVYDIYLSKLFSSREKDRDDLRAVGPHLDKQVLIERLRSTTVVLQGEPPLRQEAEKNWYILFGEPLPAQIQ